MSDNTTPAATSTTTDTSSTVDSSWDDNTSQDVWDDTPPAKEPVVKEEKPEAKDTKQDKEEQRKVKRWLEAKVNGKVEKVDEETLLRDYQKYKAAEEKFQQASQAEKSVKAFLDALQKDPMKVLNNPNLPIDRKKLAEEWIYKEIQQELNQLDPKDARVQELEAKLQEYQSKEEQEQQTQKDQEYEKIVAAKKQELGNMFSEAMSRSTLSKNPETAAATLREMALYYRACKEQGETPTPEELAQHVEQKYFKGLYSLAETLDGEELVQFLGEGLVKKIRKYDLSRLSSKAESTFSNPSKGESWSESKSPNQRRSMTPQDAREAVNKRLLGK
jgi:hypothetical protein